MIDQIGAAPCRVPEKTLESPAREGGLLCLLMPRFRARLSFQSHTLTLPGSLVSPSLGPVL